jgi:indole-3-glycerol phosphate synthase
MILVPSANRPENAWKRQKKKNVPYRQVRERAEAMAPRRPLAFKQALKAPGMSFICEVKKASPSKGLIAKEFPYVEIAREYEAAGAAAFRC